MYTFYESNSKTRLNQQVGAGDGIGFHSEFIVFSLAIGEEVAPKVMVEATDDDIYKEKQQLDIC